MSKAVSPRRTSLLLFATLLILFMFAAQAQELPVRTIPLSGDVKLEMVKVEAGTFEMSTKDGENGSDEVPHQATLTRDFYIGKTEVTQAQWKAVMGSNPSFFKGDDLPVERVSWNMVMAFCEKLNETGRAPDGWMFTLPTETQWEYAARGGKESSSFLFSGSDDIDAVAWFRDNSGDMTHPVGQKAANELGLHDMSGNVYEWCLDDWMEDGSKLKSEFLRGNDKDGPNRADRGGSWFSMVLSCRPSFRGSIGPGTQIHDIGFRVALVPKSY